MERALLLVDDEPSMLKALRRELHAGDYELVTASSGEEALAILATREIPVILSDHRMPGMTGVEFLTQARALWPDSVRMILSGYADIEVITEAVNRGHIYKFLSKPWETAELRSTVVEAFAYHDLIQQSAQFARIFAHSGEGIVIVGHDQRIERINPAFTAMTGYAPADLVGLHHEVLHAVAPQRLPFDDMCECLKSGSIWSGEVWSLRKNGESFPAALTVSAIRDANGKVSQYVALCVDITERKQREMALRESEKRFRDFMEFAPIGMVIVALDGQLLKVNRALCAILGYDREELEGSNFEYLSHPDDLVADLSVLRRLLSAELSVWQVEKRLLRKDGRQVWAQLTAAVLRDTRGVPQCFDVQIEDISERRRHQEQVRKLAYFDALTGLPNRRLLEERLEQALSLALRNERLGALIFLDLDRFKQVNDVHGHDAGDELLKLAAQRLLGCIRNADTVARHGGDEFILVLAEIASAQGAQRVAEKIGAALAAPFELASAGVVVDYVTASIGIALFPEHGRDAVTLMKRADLAMYAAKEAGRNTCRVFFPELETRD